MRQHKYRVFVKDDRYGANRGMYYIDLDDEISEFDTRIMQEHKKMQLAREKDGVEYYEGDIVTSNSYKDRKWVVTWVDDSEYCGFVPKEIGKDTPSFFVSWGDMKIIGNICESDLTIN